MKRYNFDQKGFTVMESTLVVVILAIIGCVGYFVLHTHRPVTTTTVSSSTITKPSAASSSAATQALKETATNRQVFNIKEWGVQAPYKGNLTLQYSIGVDGHTAGFTSAQLVAMDPACTPLYGGAISRYAPNDDASYQNDGSLTASKRAADTPKSEYAFIGGYYYFFSHAQSACPSPNSIGSAETNLQQATTDAVHGLLGGLQAMSH